MEKDMRKILQDFNLRVTDCRAEVLNVFLSYDYALSNADLENDLHTNFDRVTIYRTLRTFLDKGIIHKVLDDTGNPKYALCKEECSQKEHHHYHVHFKCIQCGQTSCLEGIEIPDIKLPQGFVFQESNLLVNGICVSCNQ